RDLFALPTRRSSDLGCCLPCQATGERVSEAFHFNPRAGCDSVSDWFPRERHQSDTAEPEQQPLITQKGRRCSASAPFLRLLYRTGSVVPDVVIHLGYRRLQVVTLDIVHPGLPERGQYAGVLHQWNDGELSGVLQAFHQLLDLLLHLVALLDLLREGAIDLHVVCVDVLQGIERVDGAAELA